MPCRRSIACIFRCIICCIWWCLCLAAAALALQPTQAATATDWAEGRAEQAGLRPGVLEAALQAGEAMRKLSKLIGPSGVLLTNSQNAESQNTKYQADLAKLETRMTTLLARYNKQFSSMESIVGGVNSQKTSLKSTFEGMMASLTGKNS